ncbi:type II toxin-antitoxin system VapC family toxin [Labrys okinawensis]|uniref:type II toxin-antitoxin system VapC family toxin n=1 Tax=Labrys okinawensis TaxID=346911 RepID=UPI0039BD7459
MPVKLLLDTCAAIWVAEGAPINDATLKALDEAAGEGHAVYVSPMTAWEVGMLVSRGRLALTVTPQVWFKSLLSELSLRLTELAPEVLIASSFLPGDPPRDPADRIIAATAREKGYTLVTRDRLLLAYGEQGHIQTLAC